MKLSTRHPFKMRKSIQPTKMLRLLNYVGQENNTTDQNKEEKYYFQLLLWMKLSLAA